MTNKQKVELTAELKVELVESVKDAWGGIGFNLLQAKPTKEMLAEEIREVVANYVNHEKWWQLTQEQKDEVLVAAITRDGCL